MVIFLSGTYFAYAKGYIRWINIEAHFVGTESEENKTMITALLFQAGHMVAVTTVKHGRVRFSSVRRQPSVIMLLTQTSNTVAMKEVTRHLEQNDLLEPTDKFTDNFVCETYKIVSSNACYFEIGVHDLDSAGETAVENMASIVPQGPYRIMISGHADDTGNEERNVRLSDNRAVSTYDCAKSNNIAGNKPILCYFGSARPAIPGTTTLIRQKNRRAEILILQKVQPATFSRN